MARAKKTAQPLTTAQQLGSLIKSARDIMPKDKGVNGDLDRLPMLTWIMFLKFLDDMEKIPATRWAALRGGPCRMLEVPVMQPTGIESIIKFFHAIENQEAKISLY